MRKFKKFFHLIFPNAFIVSHHYVHDGTEKVHNMHVCDYAYAQNNLKKGIGEVEVVVCLVRYEKLERGAEITLFSLISMSWKI